ncbi:MAG: T9SS type A sorting domain-containing protein [Chitinophagales bacterium]|nr:T9SS type A sorting domain-containing protein [Chitinophagales bacterium]
MVSSAASSAGDVLTYDLYAPGAYKLQDHYADTNVRNKIKSDNWDYIVIQGQSQEPVTHTSQFFGGAHGITDIINQYKPCSVIMLYMTWGRKNGDSANCPKFPVMCTYDGMDTTIRDEYLELAGELNAEVSPVSIAWHYLRVHYPNINLYQPDESHPSLAGTYAAACCFYTTLFKKDPTGISFNPGLSAGDAAIIRSVVKTQVYSKLSSWDMKLPPSSDFTYQVGAGVNEVLFHMKNRYMAETILWDFGDNTTSDQPYPSHLYSSNGTYKVSLTTTNCDMQGMHTSTTDTIIQFCSHTPTIYTNNAWLCNYDTLWTQTADSYQWFYNYDRLPEHDRSLINYKAYGISQFAVMSTVNGCSELSQTFSKTPEWSGYYFDIMPNGDPCKGDTVWFSVLHINGTLSGTENILWYRNDTLLQSSINKDTLFITTEGKYECKVVDPATHCPYDTTTSSVTFNCGTTYIAKSPVQKVWRIFPNPVNSSITVTFAEDAVPAVLNIYNTAGYLVQKTLVESGDRVDVSDLSPGLYFIRLGNGSYSVLKFVKQ